MVSLRPMRRSNFCGSVSLSISSISFHLSHGFASISHGICELCSVHCGTVALHSTILASTKIRLRFRQGWMYFIALHRFRLNMMFATHTIIKLTFMFSSYLIIKTLWNNFTLHFWPMLLTLSNKLLKKWWWRRRPDLMHHLQSGKSSKRSKRWFFNGKITNKYKQKWRRKKKKTQEPNDKSKENRHKKEIVHFINVIQFVSIEWSNFTIWFFSSSAGWTLCIMLSGIHSRWHTHIHSETKAFHRKLAIHIYWK